jgi:3-oxoacyl-[acyl-carrier protein] reductase
MTGSLRDRVAIVSGSGRGIGREIALRLAREGARIVVNDLDDEPGQAVAAEIEEMGGEAALSIGDVTVPGFAQEFVGTALDRFGRLDIVVNNAGYTWDAVIQKMSDEQWSAIMDVHLTAPFRILREAGKHFRETADAAKGGGIRKVVNISSIAGLYGNAGQANYSSAKAGVTGLTRALAKEWGAFGVCVNTVAFGLVRTRLTQTLGDQGTEIDVQGRAIRVGLQASTIEAFERQIPLQRAGTPEEAANGVFLMCAPESDYVTGQVLTIGGGLAI